MTDASPNDGALRLEALHRYQILDTPPETAFDKLTQLAAQICQTPVALITFVDANRQWFKSRFGAEMTESPMEAGFCPFVVKSGHSLVILDTLADERFATNPVVVAPPHVRFYAGVPLIATNGHLLGTLCVFDFVPRQLNQEQINALQTLSDQVMTQLDLQFTARQVMQRDAALIEVNQAVSASIGEAFFYSLVQHSAKALGVDYVYIGLLANTNSESIQTIATCVQGQIVDNFEYLLRDTPCREVIQQRKMCCYPRNVQALFPNAPLLEPLGVESYVAIPFFNSTGTPLGLLGVMDGKPLENIQLAESLLSIFAVRVVAELERQQVEAERTQLLFSEQEARQQAEAANRVKDEFLAVLSHELRSPLNPILGWSKLLQSHEFDEAKTTYALETIERNAKLQSQLIEDLLDVSRILSGKLSLNISPVSIASIVEAALETVRLAAEAKSIQFQTKFASNVGQVLGDPNRLQQVVWNLLSNAVKFTSSGGKVEIWLECVGSLAQLQVSDTGKGIDPDFLPYVFDYFRQENSATTRKFGGLGLGLAIVRHLVELHGGTVQASSPGEDLGATFTVTLPLMPVVPQMISAAQALDNSSNLEGIRILVVDDDVDTLEFLTFLLEEYGAQVRSVASALEALEVFAQWQPDLLLSDIGMPEVDGYMLIRQIRAMPSKQGGQLPAIALSAYAGETDHQQILKAGFQRHVTKPVDPDELATLIAQLVVCHAGG